MTTPPMKNDRKHLKKARQSIGRAYRVVGNVMCILGEQEKWPDVEATIAALEDAQNELRQFLGADEQVSTGDPLRWFLVNYSQPKTDDCPTGRSHMRIRTTSAVEAERAAADVLMQMGLAFKARITSVVPDTVA